MPGSVSLLPEPSLYITAHLGCFSHATAVEWTITVYILWQWYFYHKKENRFVSTLTASLSYACSVGQRMESSDSEITCKFKLPMLLMLEWAIGSKVLKGFFKIIF